MKWDALPSERAAVVRCAVVRLVRRLGSFTADDLQDELTPEEYPWDRRGFGAVLRQLVREGLLEARGYEPSRRGHARPILRFREAT